MNKLLVLSSVLLLGACTDTTVDAPTDSDEVTDAETELTTSSVDVWDSPRRLRSVYDEGDVFVALYYEAAGKEPTLTVLIKNDTSEALDLSDDMLVLNRKEEYLGKAFYDDTVVEPKASAAIELDLSAVAFDKLDDGLFYTLKLPVNGSEIPLDFYIGDAMDLIVATHGWYEELADETVPEEEQELIDWIIRHE